jgi:hypothetical protein
MKRNHVVPVLSLAAMLLTVFEGRAAPPSAKYTFLLATSPGQAGNYQYFNFDDVAGTRTVSFSNVSGSGSATGTISGGTAPVLSVTATLNKIAAGVVAGAFVQLDYYFQASGPAGDVTLDFAGNIDYPNPLPSTVSGFSIESFVDLVSSNLATTRLAYVNNLATPMVGLPASGIPGGNLNQSFVVSANSVYRIRLSTKVQINDATATTEMVLDPTVEINPVFAAAHPGYTLSFSPGFAPAPRPSMALQVLGTNAVITWPTSATGYNLQMSDDAGAPISWTTVTNVPTVVNSQNMVTNPIAGGVKFYRLKL